MLDRSKIGHTFPSFSVPVESGRLKFFAKATGNTNPLYTDKAAAEAAGYRDLPAPPTFLFSLDLEGPEFFPVLKLLGMDIGRVLHGSQEFEYHRDVVAGDEITVEISVADIFDKKGGALEFVVQESRYTNQNGESVGKSISTLVYQNS